MDDAFNYLSENHLFATRYGKTMPSRDYDMIKVIMKLRGIKRMNIDSLLQQLSILKHIHQHEPVSFQQLQSLYKVSKITMYRQTGVLKHCGLVTWKGSHKKGGYHITEAGIDLLTKSWVRKAYYL